MPLTPILDRIIVRRDAPEEKTAGGVIIPGVAQEKQSFGEIVAAGKGGKDKNGKLVPLGVKAGDRIIFNGGFTGVPVEVDGEELLVMRERDVLAVRA